MLDELFNVSDYEMLSTFLQERDHDLQAAIKQDQDMLKHSQGECYKLTSEAMELLASERKEYE